FGNLDADGHCARVIKESIKLTGLAADGTPTSFETTFGGVKALFEARMIDPVRYFDDPSKFAPGAA
ncbi:MAG: hypothetical protein JNN03_19375, partial [Rubrivivax sp.]|nr:hypothetical protein [Rubrivivax sp.]